MGSCVVDLCSISTSRTIILGSYSGLGGCLHRPSVQLCGQSGVICKAGAHEEKVAWA